MAIETIIANYWRLKDDNMVMTRVIYKTKKNQNSDIDVVCYSPKKRKSIMISVKAWGKSEDYSNFKDAHKNDKKDIFKAAKNSFRPEAFNRIKELTGKRPREGYLYLPGSIDEKSKKDWERELKRKFKLNVHLAGIHEVIESTLHIMVDYITKKHRVRFSDTSLEFIRWLIRGAEWGVIDLQKFDERVNPFRYPEDYQKDLKNLYVGEVLKKLNLQKYKKEGSSILVLATLAKLQGRKRNKWYTANKIIKRIKARRGFSWHGLNAGLGRLYKMGLVEKNKKDHRIQIPFYEAVRHVLRRDFDEL